MSQTFQLSSAKLVSTTAVIHNPVSKLTVWPLSLSLAATSEIDFSFSSSGYLDVSVPRVAFIRTIYSYENTYTLL